MHASSHVRRQPPLVTVIVVNWNAGDLLTGCVDSVLSHSQDSDAKVEVIVVDNASEDGSIQALQARPKVTAVRNASNRGFAAACNQGASLARGEFLLFLNPDCRVMAGSIDACRFILERDSSVGVVGVALFSDSGCVSRSCHRFPSPRHFFYRLSGLASISDRFPDGSMRDWDHSYDRRVDHVMGAFYMVRRHEFLATGGFDERFFVYLEDLDLSLRYRQLGQDCMFLASARAYHKGGGTSERSRAARLFYATRSRVLYAFKHFGAAQAWLHLAATLIVEPLARLAQLTAHGRPRDMGQVLRGFALLYRDLPATLRLARSK